MPVETEVSAGHAGSATKYVEQEVERCGGVGLFQYKYLIVTALCWFYSGMLPYLALFAGRVPEVEHCEGAVCTVSHMDCSLPRAEQEYVNAASTYIATFDLVCDRSHLAPILTTFYFLGSTISMLVIGRMQDLYGRRLAFIFGVLVQQSGVLACAVAQDYTHYAAGYLLAGLGNPGVAVTSFIWTSEVLSVEDRSILAWMPNAIFGVGQMTLSMLAWVLPQWRHLLLAEFILGCLLLPLAFWLQESPRWLASVGRLRDAHAVLTICAEENRAPRPLEPPVKSVSRDIIGDESGCRDMAQETVDDRVGFVQLLLDDRLRSRFLILSFMWPVTAMTFYALSLNVGSLPLDVYTANAFAGLVNIPGSLMGGILAQQPLCGRRGTAVLGFGAAGAGLVLSCLGGSSQTPLYFIALCSITGAFATMYIWGAELFPTSIRGTAMGYAMFANHGGGILAPLILGLASKAHPSLPMMLCAIPCLMAAGLALFVPETRGKTLPGSMADLDQEGEQSLSADLPNKIAYGAM